MDESPSKSYPHSIPRPGQIHAKIRAVCDEVGNMSKDGKNSFANYNFVSYDAAMSAIRPSLSRHKLRLKFSDKTRLVDATLKTATGKPATGATVVLTLYVIDIETGEFDDLECSNYSTDTGDKALAQATTGAKKYGLFSMFEISTSGGANAVHDDGDAQEKNKLDDGPAVVQPTAAPKTDPDSPASAKLVARMAALIERVAALDPATTVEKVLARSGCGKKTLGETSHQQAIAICNALTKYGTTLKDRALKPKEETPHA